VTTERLPHPSLARARDLGLKVTMRSFLGGESNLLADEPDEESMQVAIVVRAFGAASGDAGPTHVADGVGDQNASRSSEGESATGEV